MNALTLQILDDLGLSFVLLVDGRPMGDLVSTLVDSLIPYWIVDDDLPRFPPLGESAGDSVTRIIAVCSCGEYGCGHTRCQVHSDGDRVVLEDFENDVSDTGRTRRFEFKLPNYNAIVREVVARAQAHKALEKARR